MADNIKIQAGTGNDTVAPPCATDDIGGVHYQRIKIHWGADGVATATEDNAAGRFPIKTVHESVVTCTVASGATASGAVDLAGIRNFGLIVPSTFDGSAITFQTSDTLGGTYQAIYDIYNNPLGMTVAASRTYDTPGELSWVRFLKIICGTAQATTDTVFLLVAKS